MSIRFLIINNNCTCWTHVHTCPASTAKTFDFDNQLFILYVKDRLWTYVKTFKTSISYTIIIIQINVHINSDYNSAICGFDNSSSILTNSLSLAILSPPAAPVLITGAWKATAKCAIVSSVVSPDLCETTGT